MYQQQQQQQAHRVIELNTPLYTDCEVAQAFSSGPTSSMLWIRWNKICAGGICASRARRKRMACAAKWIADTGRMIHQYATRINSEVL